MARRRFGSFLVAFTVMLVDAGAIRLALLWREHNSTLSAMGATPPETFERHGASAAPMVGPDRLRRSDQELRAIRHSARSLRFHLVRLSMAWILPDRLGGHSDSNFVVPDDSCPECKADCHATQSP